MIWHHCQMRRAAWGFLVSPVPGDPSVCHLRKEACYHVTDPSMMVGPRVIVEEVVLVVEAPLSTCLRRPPLLRCICNFRPLNETPFNRSFAFSAFSILENLTDHLFFPTSLGVSCCIYGIFFSSSSLMSSSVSPAPTFEKNTLQVSSSVVSCKVWKEPDWLRELAGVYAFDEFEPLEMWF